MRDALQAQLLEGALTEPDVIRRILEHLDLPSIAPTPAPPQLELGFEGC